MIKADWTAFVSKRWYKSGKQNGPSLLPARWGIAVGVCAMLVIIGVMNGFQMGFMETVLEMDSYHLRMKVDKDAQEESNLIKTLPGIISAMPFKDCRVLATGPLGRSSPLKLKIVPNDFARQDPGLASLLGVKEDEELNGLIIGEVAARNLNAGPGDYLEILDLLSSEEEGISIHTETVRIAMIYHSNYFDFDAGLVFAPRQAISQLGNDEDWYSGIKLKDRWALDRAISRIEKATGRTDGITGWREYNRSFFSALKMEKTIMLILVGLIFLVVGVNIFHAMRRIVFARMEDIAVLKSLGGSPESLRFTFLRIGIGVGAGGALFGLIAGLLLAMNINTVFGIIETALAFLAHALGSGRESFHFFSPDTFYITEVPVKLPFAEVLFISLAGTLSAVLASFAASHRVLLFKPSEVLRNE